LAATIANAKVYQQFHSDQSEHALMHGPTFMGNPTACAAANASLDLFEADADQDRLQQVEQIEKILQSELQPLTECTRVRGTFVRPLRDVVYLAPSFTIEEDELRMLSAAIVEFVS